MAPVRTLERGLHILDRIITSEGPLRLHKVAEEFAIDPAMAHRFLQTLCKSGLVHKDPKTKTYAPGGHFYSWMVRAKRRLDIVDTIHPYLLDVVRRTEQSAHLGILVDDQALLVDFAPSDNVISVKNRVGVLEPVFCTAIGKAILSQLSRRERERIIDAIELVPYTPRTITNRDALHQHLDDVAAKGFAVDDGEFNELLACVAVPLKAPGGFPALSMGVSMIRPIVAEDHKIIDRVARQLKQVATEIKAALSGA